MCFFSYKSLSVISFQQIVTPEVFLTIFFFGCFPIFQPRALFYRGIEIIITSSSPYDSVWSVGRSILENRNRGQWFTRGVIVLFRGICRRYLSINMRLSDCIGVIEMHNSREWQRVYIDVKCCKRIWNDNADVQVNQVKFHWQLSLICFRRKLLASHWNESDSTLNVSKLIIESNFYREFLERDKQKCFGSIWKIIGGDNHRWG